MKLFLKFNIFRSNWRPIWPRNDQKIPRGWHHRHLDRHRRKLWLHQSQRHDPRTYLHHHSAGDEGNLDWQLVQNLNVAGLKKLTILAFATLIKLKIINEFIQIERPIVKMNGTRYLSKICIWLRINIHKASFISDGIV